LQHWTLAKRTTYNAIRKDSESDIEIYTEHKMAASGTYECLCKKTGFQVSGEPAVSVYCHCNSCRISVGDAARLAGYKPGQFRITHGADNLIEYESSHKTFRVSCATCGSFVHKTNPDGLQVVPLGGIKWESNGKPVVPEHHIFVAD